MKRELVLHDHGHGRAVLEGADHGQVEIAAVMPRVMWTQLGAVQRGHDDHPIRPMTQ